MSQIFDEKPCERCGTDISLRASSARFCKKCISEKKYKRDNPHLSKARKELTAEIKKRRAMLVDIINRHGKTTSELLYRVMREEGFHFSDRSFRNDLQKLYADGRIDKKGELSGTVYSSVEALV